MYRVTFGRHKGLVPSLVHKKDPTYFVHQCAQQAIPQPLVAALREAGLWEGIVEQSKEAQRAWQARALRKRDEVQTNVEAGEEVHQEVRALVKVQAERAEEEQQLAPFHTGCRGPLAQQALKKTASP